MLAPKRITPRKILIEAVVLAAVLGVTLYFFLSSMQPGFTPPVNESAVPNGALLAPLPDLNAGQQLFANPQYQGLQSWVDLPVQIGIVGNKPNPFSTSTAIVIPPR